MRVSWWNDLFSELPPADDSGFTSDFKLESLHRTRAGRVGARLFYRMITEQYEPGTLRAPKRRWDQLDAIGVLQRTRDWRQFHFLWEGRGGVTLVGNLGGRKIQNGWHQLSKSGATLDEGLQNTYAGGRRPAIITGSRFSITRQLQILEVSAGADGQFALGSTGVSFISGFVGVSTELDTGDYRFDFGGEVALENYSTRDPNLALFGAYAAGGDHFAFRVHAVMRTRLYSVGWQYRANEGGSGEPTGLFLFGYAH